MKIGSAFAHVFDRLRRFRACFRAIFDDFNAAIVSYDSAHHLNIHVNRHHGTTLENSKNNVTLLTITSISGIIVAKETVAIATAVNEVSTC
jgi:hypothetical protein